MKLLAGKISCKHEEKSFPRKLMYVPVFLLDHEGSPPAHITKEDTRNYLPGLICQYLFLCHYPIYGHPENSCKISTLMCSVSVQSTVTRPQDPKKLLTSKSKHNLFFFFPQTVIQYTMLCLVFR